MSKTSRAEKKVPSETAKDGKTENAQVVNREGLINEKMYSIQIGCKTFKLSGASISSDSPSYFTTFFSDKANNGRVLFIDRSPVVFEKIYLHLQGYYIHIMDEFEFVYLFADAHYFNLTGLKNLLFKSDIFTRVGNKSFRISKELITSEGNFPNYFSVSFNALFADPLHAISNFFRPPPLEPPILSNHSPELFEEILGYLQGKSITITNEQHRQELLKECRYYKFLALEQKLVNHRILLNPFSYEEEIILDLRDLKRKGLQLDLKKDPDAESILKYSRPFADKNVYRNLILQIESSECTLYIKTKSGVSTLEFLNNTGKTINTILKTVSSRVTYDQSNLAQPMIVDLSNCHCVINEREMVPNWIDNMAGDEKLEDKIVVFKIIKAQYRILFRGEKPWFQGLMLKGVSDTISYNKQVGFI